MKIKELKEMIKNAFIAEETNAEYFYEPMEEINANDSLNEVDDIDFVANLEAELAEGEDKVVDPYIAEDLSEAEEEEIERDAEEETTDGGEEKSDSIVVDKKIVSLSSLPNDTRKILDSLETLRAQAEEFGDQKFITQVGNTITFFTRDFVVAGDEPTKAKVDESDDMEEGKKSNKQKLIDAGYSESDAEDFVDEFEQGGVKVPQKVKDILSDKSSMNESMFPMWKKIK